ncbi:MAG: Spy/CpxP family protein refolding chaperone [Thermodesulfobacteriota bacterium]|nr:Spy/CpxP family protein refolding chaperone [Thermodesulfobacteriota bacterium]
MKKLTIVSLVAFFVITMPTLAYTDDDYKKMKHKDNLEEKVFKKAHIILKNKDELKLSDKQITGIKNLKLNAKKDLIRKKAEIDAISVDIKSKLYDETIDVSGINKLVDQKYDLKKEKTKSLIAAYAELKKILSEEQKEKLEELMSHTDRMKMKRKD